MLAIPTLTVYRYKHLPYPPLEQKNASKCLQSLVMGIKSALDELHNLDLAHNDIRLENVCFNDQFQVVLIDIDRYYPASKLHPMFTSSSGTSCMYRSVHTLCNGYQTDFFQLGWLISWVLDSTGEDYHGRTWESQRADIKNDQFISTLILRGEFNPTLLEGSLVAKSDRHLKSVLSNRK